MHLAVRLTLIAILARNSFSSQRCDAAAQNDGISSVRIATFNCSLNREVTGELLKDLQGGQDKQARKVAQILRTVRPQVVLLNEFDFDMAGESVACFLKDYVASTAEWVSEAPLSYPHTYFGPVNTGVTSGRDLDHDGTTDGPGDAIGFGKFPGQYGMVVLSQFPIQESAVRSFQKLLWKDMPAAVLPPALNNPHANWYSEDDLNVLRISSKSHWDVPINIDGRIIHLLASHPTPPAFDGPEDRNGRRNRDEIRLWAEYISSAPQEWLVDDKGIAGPLAADSAFVVLGDQNADPNDGGSYDKAINLLLNHPRINSDLVPSSEGGAEATKIQKGVNLTHTGDASQDTADFSDRSVGNLRADYVLPSKNLNAIAAGIYWPASSEPGADLINCSDHRLVWIDIQIESK